MAAAPRCAFCAERGVWYLNRGAPCAYYCDAHYTAKEATVPRFALEWRVVNDQGVIGTGPLGPLMRITVHDKAAQEDEKT
jgi:hypothetical protein